MDLTALAKTTESIGRNCEFAFVQRKIGVEPISLLRWGGAPMPGVIAGLQARFAGLMDEATGRITKDGHWWLTDVRYGLVFHTAIPEATPIAEATAKVRARLRRLAEKLIEDIGAADKLFLYSDRNMQTPTDAEPLLAAMRSIGPRAALVAVCMDADRSGTAERVIDGLIGSYARKLANTGAPNEVDHDQWPDVIRAAHRVWREMRDISMAPLPLHCHNDGVTEGSCPAGYDVDRQVEPARTSAD